MAVTCWVIVTGSGQGQLTFEIVPRSGEHVLIPDTGECRVDRVVHTPIEANHELHAPIEANQPERVVLYVSRIG